VPAAGVAPLPWNQAVDVEALVGDPCLGGLAVQADQPVLPHEVEGVDQDVVPGVLAAELLRVVEVRQDQPCQVLQVPNVVERPLDDHDATGLADRGLDLLVFVTQCRVHGVSSQRDISGISGLFFIINIQFVKVKQTE
jgi:hypothetical protein